jgi:hypothetical protein
MTDRRDPVPPGTEILLYPTGDGQARLEVRFEGDTAWLSLGQMAELFQRDKSVISRHVKAALAEGELAREAVVAVFATTGPDGKTYQVEYYGLDVILAVGYRVKSLRGTQFRQWATARLHEYVVKGFAMDDVRLKNPPGPGVPDYFDELLARIRDIRSSEKVFWRKVLEIYATSVDYDASAEASQRFFATVQNKMHFAAHGHTAAEVIAERADAGKPNMGLSTWSGSALRKTDVGVAKNYLAGDELEALNRIVSAYLEFAQLQALGRRPMHMADWIAKLDEYLRLSDREVLDNAGGVSHEAAVARAQAEYDRFARQRAELSSQVERDFEASVQAVKQIETRRPRARKGRKE